MTFSRLLTFLSTVVAASAQSLVLHEQLAAPPADYVRVGAAPANEMITWRVALASNNITGLEEELTSIATPGSGNFRKWLSKEEVPTYIQPSSETVSDFGAFASANGFTPTVISPQGDLVSLTLPVSQASTLFAADFQHYTHRALDGPITLALSFTSPVGADVRFAPILTAPHLDHRDQVRPPASYIRNPGDPRHAEPSSLLVTGYGNEFAHEADLAKFLTFRPDMSNCTTFTMVTTDNGINPQDANLTASEPNLDIPYTAGIATNVPLDFLSVGGTDLATAFFDTTTHSQHDEPMTTSFGDVETRFGASVATELCNQYMVQGAMGISVLFASGNGGVRGAHDISDQCTNNTFVSVFPSTCPGGRLFEDTPLQYRSSQ
ncbi:hypothetical protein C8R45DRAFT_1131053 [Mycena sanguinolenta]|nr:hypothetical protein C8R45DRAFT_1131053 [Mycena sanguinolenta]